MVQLLLFSESDGWSSEGLSRRNVPHPIPYQGSKRHLASTILSYCPRRVRRLVEPFAGSAAISLAAANLALASNFWINDVHAPLTCLWQAIIDRPEELAAQYAALWQEQLGRERDYYDLVRERFNQTHRPDCFLYLLARCVKAAIRYNSEGGFNNSPDNRRKGAHPKTMRVRIVGASQLLQSRTLVTMRDYREILTDCHSSDLIYLDPPYQGVCGNRDNRYAPKIDRDEFCAALEDLNRRGCMFLVSYDGRTGTKTYGEPLPQDLGLTRIELFAGRSTQATLLGRAEHTIESLYLSPVLADTIHRAKRDESRGRIKAESTRKGMRHG